jgi:hypothetical protein
MRDQSDKAVVLLQQALFARYRRGDDLKPLASTRRS